MIKSKNTFTLNRLLIFIALAWIVGTTLFHFEIDSRNSKLFNFKFRETIGKSPKISNKLKVLTLDDQAVSMLQNLEFSADQWSQVFETLAKRKPKAIYIDKIFSFIPTNENSKERFIHALKLTPTFVAGSTSKVPSLWRHPITMITPGTVSKDHAINIGSELSQSEPTQIYGPIEWVSNAATGVGLISGHKFGTVPISAMALDGTYVLHLGLLSQSTPFFQRSYNGLTGSTHRFVNSNARIIVNFPTAEELYSKSFSLSDVIGDLNSQSASKIEYIQPEDTILILPLFYTGNTDFTDTPIGRIPGGFILSALLNSGITSDWIFENKIAQYLFSFFIPVASLFAGMTLTPFSAITAIFIIVFLSTTIGLLSFGLFNIELTWLGPTINALALGVIANSIRYIKISSNLRKFNASLGGLFPKHKLNFLIDEIESIKKAPIERELTIMFIDIAGFSNFSEKESAEIVFSSLSSQLDRLSRIVHSFGGIVDKSLGDGMLCFFGYDYTGKNTKVNHADSAIDCAIAIQVENMNSIIEQNKLSTLKTLPLRIGINTGLVYIGDLGGAERIDFTIIGNAVNLAQRLESGCETNKILISQTSLEHSTRSSQLNENILQRKISIKHRKNLTETYEIDPYYLAPKLTSQWQKYQKSISENHKNREDRFRKVPVDSFSISINDNRSKLLGFSKNGVLIRTESYFGKGLLIKLSIIAEDPNLNCYLIERGLDVIQCEVRWGKKITDSGDYEHGCRYQSLTENQRTQLLSIFHGGK
jgi:class 3 adenylate cyclase